MSDRACTKCKETKPESDFSIKASKGGKIDTQCKECRAAASRKWRTTHKAENYATIVAWRKAHPEKIREYNRRQEDKRKAQRTANRVE